VPEVVLGEGKTADQIVAIVRELVAAGDDVLVTRLDDAAARAVLAEIPGLQHHPIARVATFEARPIVAEAIEPVAIVTAGTSDVPVAEEAFQTLRMIGIPATRVFDVGVAGIHRVFGELDVLTKAPAVMVVAGLEGALPSVVGGLVAVPVIAVPTSVGYGASFGGIAPLLTMLNSCAAGVSVVNIDNGFGAGYLAAVINRLALSERPD
jgi:hypothetical protein